MIFIVSAASQLSFSFLVSVAVCLLKSAYTHITANNWPEIAQQTELNCGIYSQSCISSNQLWVVCSVLAFSQHGPHTLTTAGTQGR